VAFSRDGRLATGCDDYCIRIWDETGKLAQTSFECGSEVMGLAFSPDGNRLASANMDEKVRLWDLTNNKRLMMFEGHKGAVLGVSFHHNCRRLASAGRDGTIRIWDATPATAEDLHTVPWQQGLTTRSNHSVAVRKEFLALPGSQGEIKCVAFSPHGDLLASAGLTVKLWDGQPLPER
jgi:WD40 repeat protein